MDIPEQAAPNEPNFKLIVILALVALLAILMGGYFFLHREAGHILPDGKTAHPVAGTVADVSV